MGKLWDKGYKVDRLVEKYTVGDDYVLDERLIPYDIFGNIAHAIMLYKIGILSEGELKTLKKGLREIWKLYEKGEFHIKREDEDVHTKVENYLTEKYGDIGKKIHTARSRNDQIILDVRLYMKDALLNIETSLTSFSKTILSFSEDYLCVPMPGYTHTRIAMPSSVGLWSHALFSAIFDDISLIESVFALINQSPLGSAAGYGVPIPINRELVAELLGFNGVQKNVIYVQNSRGKFELIIIDILEEIMIDLSRFATDLIYFTMPKFEYFTLPREMLLGSSIMPQKENPDIFEILRGKVGEISSFKVALSNILGKLHTGYSRDLQLTKGYLFKAFDITLSGIEIMNAVFKSLHVNTEELRKDFTREIFATDYALKLVEEKGIPFREAYREIAKNIDKIKSPTPEEVIEKRIHLGTACNLKIEEDFGKVEQLIYNLNGIMENFHKNLENLIISS